jgi:hypothetical protein
MAIWNFNHFGFNGIFTSPINVCGFKLQYYILCSNKMPWTSVCIETSVCLNTTFCFYRKKQAFPSVLPQASHCILSCKLHCCVPSNSILLSPAIMSMNYCSHQQRLKSVPNWYNFCNQNKWENILYTILHLH